jgi:uncharacterized protein YcbK (DUF882 family)
MTGSPQKFARRSVLAGMLAAPFVVRPAAAWSNTRHVRFHNIHTLEKINATYWRDGQYDREALKDLNWFLRDWRAHRIHAMDPLVLDIIYWTSHRMGSSGRAEIISGYRTPKTNSMLGSRSEGVAKFSYHMRGQAIDFRLEDRSVRDTHKAVLVRQYGGVGLYTKSQFIHVDTGPVRSWGA